MRACVYHEAMNADTNDTPTPDPRALALGLEIRAEAAARQVNLRDLAQQAGMSRATLYRYLDASRDMPVASLMAVADVLRVHPFELIERAENRARRDSRLI